MNEEQPIFKVTDRRLFNSDGTPREVERAEEAQKEARPEAARVEASATPEEQHAPSAGDRAAVSRTDEPTRDAARPAAAASPEPPERSDTRGASATAASARRPAPDDAAEQFAEDDFAESDIPGADDPTSFLNFLMSLASNAAAALGMMEHPATGQRAVDPELAKHWIDVLGMLQQKTRGNLAPQEQQIFEGLLADLRMQYVSLPGTTLPKAQRGFTGSDITGGR